MRTISKFNGLNNENSNGNICKYYNKNSNNK